MDIIPSDHPVLPPTTPRKKQNVLTSLLFGKKTQNSVNKAKLSAVGVVEELFEEGSAMLAERYVFCFISVKKVANNVLASLMTEFHVQ